MQCTNNVWIGETSRIDNIIQTQIAILVLSRITTTLVYLILLVKFSWTNGCYLLIVLVDNFSFEVTNNSPFDVTVAVTLVTTYLTYRNMILAMVVRQCLSTLPWNASLLHSFTDDLVFIPGPICYIFVIAMCMMKHLLSSFRMCVRLSYVAVYLGTVLLVTGALTNQGPEFTAIRTVEPYTFRPTFVAPMVSFYYRTSPHLDTYFYMAYSVVLAIVLAILGFQLWVYVCKKRGWNRKTNQAIMEEMSQTSFDVAVGLAIRFPGGFMDKRRMYVPGTHHSPVKSTVYSLALAGYIEIDGCLMVASSVLRCLAAYVLGSSIDTTGSIHYFQLTDDGKAVDTHNKVHGYETLRVLQTSDSNSTYQSLVDVTDQYSDLLGLSQQAICVTNYDSGTSMCGSIKLPPPVVASLTIDAQKTNAKPETPPSCTHPKISNLVYSIMDADIPKYYCAPDPTLISDIRGFANWMVMTGIPTIPNQVLLSPAAYIPSGYRMPTSTNTGFLDTTPNATTVMVPLMQLANLLWKGQTSRIDYIIQTQVAILILTRVATALGYLLLLVKFSWTTGRNFCIVLTDNFTFEVTNNSPFDLTAALALVMTYYTYRDMILAMVVRPVCYIFLVGMCVMKHVLNAVRVCARLSYIATYLATVILVAGALTHQGPANTAMRTVDPYAFYPTLIAPMVKFYYRTSPHLDTYFSMFYATVVAILLVFVVSQVWFYVAERRKLRSISSQRHIDDKDYTTFDVAVGLAIRFPGGFMDKSRMYVRGKHPHVTLKSTVYSQAIAGYIQIDGCLMRSTSVYRCLAAYVLGSTMDTSGPIHYFKLKDGRTKVDTIIHQTFRTHFIRDRPLWRFVKCLTLDELE
ncbi:unnamed protein product [Aphanomyces euteiches]